MGRIGYSQNLGLCSLTYEFNTMPMHICTIYNTAVVYVGLCVHYYRQYANELPE